MSLILVRDLLKPYRETEDVDPKSHAGGTPRSIDGAHVLILRKCVDRRPDATLITSVGARLMYLPPYLPDFLLIELVWSKINNQIRRTSARSAKTLQQTLFNAVQSITETDYLHWFRRCGSCVEDG